MTQVPYQGAPSVAPEDNATPYRSVSTPLAAFGGATAEAISHLGQTTESAGSEIFARGYAMQEINEQAKANEAMTNFVKDAGSAESQYLTLEGNNAVQGMKPYQEQLGALRDQHRQGLDSPLAQRYYDQETRNVQSRMIISAGSHAAQQNKLYFQGTNQAKMDAAGDQLAISPENDALIDSTLDGIRSSAKEIAGTKGWGPEQTDQFVSSQVSTQISKQIQALAKTKPLQAQAEMAARVKSGDLNSADAGRLAGYIQNQSWGVGSRQISSQVLAGQTGDYSTRMVGPDEAMPAILARESSGRYGIEVPTKTGDRALGGFGVLASNLSPWLKQAGMADMTPEEFKSDPQAQQQLFKFKWNQYLTDKDLNPTGSSDRAAEMWFSGEHSKPGNNASDGATTTPQYIQNFHASLAQQAPLQDLVSQARSAADRASPGDTVLGDMAEQHTIQQYNQQKQIQRAAEIDNENKVYSVLANGTPDGTLPSSMEQLRADPQVDAAYMAMDPKKQIQVQKAVASTAKGAMAETPETIKNWQTLYGMSANDPEKFLDQDIFNTKLTQPEKKELFKLQTNIQKKVDADPLVGHALSVLQPMLNAAGLTDRKSPEYQQFTGALHDAIKQTQDENKTLVKDKDINVIGANLLRKFGGGGWSVMHPFTGDPGTPLYQTPVPDDFMDKQLADPRLAGMDEDVARSIVQRAYAAQQYHELFGKQPAVIGPEVPRGR